MGEIGDRPRFLPIGIGLAGQLVNTVVGLKRGLSPFFHFRYDDFELVEYQAHPSIPAPIAV